MKADELSSALSGVGSILCVLRVDSMYDLSGVPDDHPVVSFVDGQCPPDCLTAQPYKVYTAGIVPTDLRTLITDSKLAPTALMVLCEALRWVLHPYCREHASTAFWATSR